MTNRISVNVIPVKKAAIHLETILERFRHGELEPIIFGEGDKPEAAIISFEDFVDFCRLAAAKEDAAQQVLSDRIREVDASDDEGTSLEDLAAELGGPAEAIIRKHHGDAR